MKKMAAEENQSAPAGTIKLNWETLLFIDSHAEFSNNDPLSSPKGACFDMFSSLENPFLSRVFRPPLV